MATGSPPALTLYGCLNSDCSTRLRLALAWKGLDYEHVDCGSPFNHGDRPARYADLNPTGAVPTLVVGAADGSAPAAITQSVAAIEYLDEVHRSPRPLLPADPLARARVRALAAVIASDTHPLTAPRVARHLADTLGHSGAGAFDEWSRAWVRRGLEAYEAALNADTAAAGRYSAGDQVSLADLCLLPEAWRARGFGMSLADFPATQKVVANLEEIECLRAAHWDRSA